MQLCCFARVVSRQSQTNLTYSWDKLIYYNNYDELCRSLAQLLLKLFSCMAHANRYDFRFAYNYIVEDRVGKNNQLRFLSVYCSRKK